MLLDGGQIAPQYQFGLTDIGIVFSGGLKSDTGRLAATQVIFEAYLIFLARNMFRAEVELAGANMVQRANELQHTLHGAHAGIGPEIRALS